MFLYYIIIGLQRATIRVRAPKEGSKKSIGEVERLKCSLSYQGGKVACLQVNQPIRGAQFGNQLKDGRQSACWRAAGRLNEYCGLF